MAGKRFIMIAMCLILSFYAVLTLSLLFCVSLLPFLVAIPSSAAGENFLNCSLPGKISHSLA
jgi:hypothetical protein